jgi:hypothetical protein
MSMKTSKPGSMGGSGKTPVAAADFIERGCRTREASMRFTGTRMS